MTIRFKAGDPAIIQLELEDFTAEVKTAKVNTTKKFKRWAHEMHGVPWFTTEVYNDLWHFCALSFEWE